MTWAMTAGVIWGMGSSAALATEAQPATVPAEFLTCYDIKQTGERLACYDRAVEYLKTGDAAAAPSAETTFGLQARETRRAESDSESEQMESVTARVSELGSSRDRMRTITLDNGQVWRQIDGSSATLRVGDEVTISRASLGSFRMSMPTGRALRVRRIQ